MPIFEYHCPDCGHEWESIEVWRSHVPEECPECSSRQFYKVIGTPHIRMDSSAIKHSLPDPVPPLRELIGKTKPGCEGGFKELENDQRELKDYNRTKDKDGNSIWLPRSKTYIDLKRTKNANKK